MNTSIRFLLPMSFFAMVTLAKSAHATTADEYYQKGQDALKKHNSTLAESSYVRALSKDPEHHASHRGLVYLYITKKDFDKGLSAAESALKYHDSDALLWTQKGLILEKLGLDEESQDAHEKALSIAPEDPRVLSESAAFYKSQGDLVTAENISQKRQVVMGQGRTLPVDDQGNVILPDPKTDPYGKKARKAAKEQQARAAESSKRQKQDINNFSASSSVNKTVAQ